MVVITRTGHEAGFKLRLKMVTDSAVLIFFVRGAHLCKILKYVILLSNVIYIYAVSLILRAEHLGNVVFAVETK